MAGKPGRSGRRRSVNTLLREALADNERLVPDYLQALRDIADDLKTLDPIRLGVWQYLVNRSQGNPRLAFDLRFGVQTPIAADDLATLDFEDKVVEVQRGIIESLGVAVPSSLPAMNEIARVNEIKANLNTKKVEVEFVVGGNIEKRFFDGGN